MKRRRTMTVMTRSLRLGLVPWSPGRGGKATAVLGTATADGHLHVLTTLHGALPFAQFQSAIDSVLTTLCESHTERCVAMHSTPQHRRIV